MKKISKMADFQETADVLLLALDLDMSFATSNTVVFS